MADKIETKNYTPKKLLSMEKIGKQFSSVRVLTDIQLDLNAGETHILAGENGAGKSTLIKILAGVYSEYEGTIKLADRVVHFKSPHDAAQNGISIIYQEMSLIPSMSVVDNIFLGREISKKFELLDTASQRKKAQELMDELGLNIDINRAVEEYPISIQQMIEIAKALVFESQIIIMDEPTSALTELEVEKLFSIIKKLKSRGCGIIYITHKMEEIYRIGDRITVLRDGKYIGTSEIEKLPQPELIRWMVGRDISQQFVRKTAAVGEERLKVDNFTLRESAGSQRTIVDDVSFYVRAGEILGLAGLQGSGNSGLLNGLFGTYGKLAKGKIKINGQPFEISSPQHSIQNGMALLTNDRKANGLVLCMNLIHNTTLAALKKFCVRDWIKPEQELKASQYRANTLKTKYSSLLQEVSTLSGGNQQKVVLSKWLETNPKIFLFDEPTRGIDIAAKHDIYELMTQLTEEGCSILLITSEMIELLAMSDRIAVMHRGKITAEFNRDNATQEKILQAAMGETGK